MVRNSKETNIPIKNLNFCSKSSFTRSQCVSRNSIWINNHTASVKIKRAIDANDVSYLKKAHFGCRYSVVTGNKPSSLSFCNLQSNHFSWMIIMRNLTVMRNSTVIRNPTMTKNVMIDEESHSDEESHGDHLLGEMVSNFVPGLSSFNIIRVKTGEDIAMKIMSHAQQGSQSICVISANGAISSAKLRKLDSSGGTFTFEFQGHCEILSLNGLFTPTENGGISNWCEWLSVSLAGPDGCVIGGGVAGQLIAGSPVQIVVGCFFPGNIQECSKETENGVLPECSRETKKQKTEATTFVAPPAVIYLPSAKMADPSYGQRASDTMNQNLSSSFSSGDNGTAYLSDSRNEPTDGNDTPSE